MVFVVLRWLREIIHVFLVPAYKFNNGFFLGCCLILNEILQMLAIGTRFQLCLYMPAFDDTDLILNAALWKDKLHCCCFLYKKQEAAFHDVRVNCS